ncbi:MAG TPA: biopolymer transporter ExbD [Clostridiales bacterium]|jgi:biopolymer transport protein ExbD|nr:biopolymer transporter ExbD [Clostridiales bacterium]HQP70166.1 biopolymer transporter ExbD [Clostridiales bacterium]
MIEKKQTPSQQAISTASLPDIIFLLLIFFMVTTVFVEYRGIPVKIPEAVNSEKIDGKRALVYCYLDLNGRICVDDQIITNTELMNVMYLKRTQNPRLIVSLKVDENSKNGLLDKVQKALQDADARRVMYAATTKTK